MEDNKGISKAGTSAAGQSFPGLRQTEAPESSQRPARWLPVLLIAVILAGVLLARFLGLGRQVGALRDWIQGLGAWGPVVFMVFYALSEVVAIPGSLLSVTAGALFGSLVGMIVVSIGATAGASLAFLIARYVARDAVVKRFSHKESFQRLDRMTEERGALIVALTRLIPLFPFNLLNYGFGLTRVPFRTYVFWSWLCMMPGILVYVGGADAVVQIITKGRVSGILLAVLAVGVVVLAILIRYARRSLQGNERAPKI